MNVAAPAVLEGKPRLCLSYAEVAQVLNTAPGTVMSRLHRARLALKEALQKDDSHEY